jgi:DNA-binding NarL/FixJ family response regulator
MAKVLAKVIHLMDLSKFNTSILESLIKLTKKRDILLDELKKLEAAITSVTSGGKSEPATVRRRRRSTGRRRSAAPAAEIKTAKDSEAQTGRRGALKARILAALRTAGDKGVAVKELSAKLGVKNQNVHVWFSSTGKKLGTIQRVGAGRYRLKPGA